MATTQNVQTTEAPTSSDPAMRELIDAVMALTAAAERHDRALALVGVQIANLTTEVHALTDALH